MRKFVVNVNGNSYEVEVEEVGGGASISQAVPAARPAVAEAAPTQAPAAPKPAAPSGTAGAIKITSPMPGSIIDIKVSVGDSVKKGTVIAILEAMKMENELLAPQDATVASINVTKGQQVNSGDLIMTLN
jgi:biotin carboxyl carrier protein